MLHKTIHRYEIIEKIGEGGMGVVYKARDPRIDRLVAIKTIKFDVGEDYADVQEKKKRFYREAKTSGQLFHQNIVTILDVDEYEDFSYIVMEYVEGETLSKRLRHAHSLGEENALSIIIQACDALHYAHAVGIIHRDIKPSNIMLIGQKQVKVADFGLAKMLSSASANITKTGGVVGTPFYMAPEQIRGEPVDARIDIFALGVVLYECLTGEKPFLGDSISTIIYKILHEDPVCIREFNSDLSPRLDDIIGKILAKDKEERYQTAEELADDLREYYYQSKSITERTAELGKTPSTGFETTQEQKYTSTGTFDDNAAPKKSKLVPSGETMHLEQPEQPLSPPSRTKWFIALFGALAMIVLLVLFWPNISFILFPGESLPVTVLVNTPTVRLEPEDITGKTTPSPDDKSGQITPVMTSDSTPEPPDGFIREAFVLINVIPADATITLDGSELGSGSVTRKVKEGEHVIEARLDGYMPASGTHTIEGSLENPTLVKLELQPKSGLISISSDPDKARITVSGKAYGTTPLKNMELIPGYYTIRLERENYRTLSFETTVKPGENLSFSKKLGSAGIGSLSINASPWANIFIDGQNYQSTPRSISEIESGIHKIKLVHPDYPPYETIVDIPVGKNIKVYQDFKKANYGTIQVNATPFGTVFIDNRLEGETPISRKVAIGKHSVRISRQGSEDQVFHITVKGGETKKVTADFKM